MLFFMTFSTLVTRLLHSVAAAVAQLYGMHAICYAHTILCIIAVRRAGHADDAALRATVALQLALLLADSPNVNSSSSTSNSSGSSGGDQRTAIQVLRQALTDLECVRGELVDPDLRPGTELAGLTRNSITPQVLHFHSWCDSKQ
jgi:hypothetical protein